MSNSDSFITEVTDEVRKDQLFGYMRRYGWIAVLVVLLLVGGTAWREYRQAQDTAAARAAGDEILAALQIDDDAARAEALAAIDAEGGAGAVTGLLAAANLMETDEAAAATEQLEEVALAEGTPAVYRELAALKAAMLAGPEMSAEDRRAALSGLAMPGSIFRLIAQEQLALMSIEDGDRDTALQQFAAIAEDAEVTPGLRARAIAMIDALGGDNDALVGNTGAENGQEAAPTDG